jgi:F-type H+-transporting ATPase subunit alpha
MKKVAGTLRTEMAQFRELEAFAQFGSDLDKSTQRQLNRGRRLVQVLKQPQFKPMPAEKEVMILFAAARGYLDEWPETAVSEYENQMLEFMESKHHELLREIKNTGEINNELDYNLIKALDEFRGLFKAPA